MVFGLSSMLGERYARELCVVFGLLIGICVAYALLLTVHTGKTWFDRGKVDWNNSLISRLLFLE